MSELFALQGSLGVSPGAGAPSGELFPVGTLDEKLVCKNKLNTIAQLLADPAVAVPFGGLAGAHVVSLKVTGGVVTARFTSAKGATQSIPVDSYLFILSRGEPFTAIDLTRTPGTDTTVEVFIAEKA